MELAFISIPLVLMTVGAIDLARAIYTYDQLAKAVRDGARLLSGFDPTIPAEYPKTLAIDRIVYGASPGPSPSPIVPGLDSTMVEVCDRIDSSACPAETFANVPTGTGSINLVKVQIVGYVYDPVFPGVSRLATITFDTISATMRQVR